MFLFVLRDYSEVTGKQKILNTKHHFLNKSIPNGGVKIQIYPDIHSKQAKFSLDMMCNKVERQNELIKLLKGMESQKYCLNVSLHKKLSIS